MSTWARGILLVGLDDALARRAVLALEPLGMHFQRTRSLATMRKTVGVTHFAAVVLAYAQDRIGRANRDEVCAWSDSCGRCAAVVMLCPAALLGQARAWLGRGISRVVGIDAIAEELRGTVAELLGVAPRVRLRMPVRLVPESTPVAAATPGRTENISSSGMLVSCPDEFAVGGAVRFEIVMPDNELKVQGSARVVRRADPTREGARGIAARFTSFLGPGAVRLDDLLSRHTF